MWTKQAEVTASAVYMARGFRNHAPRRLGSKHVIYGREEGGVSEATSNMGVPHNIIYGYMAGEKEME